MIKTVKLYKNIKKMSTAYLRFGKAAEIFYLLRERRNSAHETMYFFLSFLPFFFNANYLIASTMVKIREKKILLKKCYRIVYCLKKEKMTYRKKDALKKLKIKKN